MVEEQVSILFADVKGFTRLHGAEVQAFIERFMGEFARKLEPRKDRIKVANTWGDAIFLIFPTAREAAECALDLRDLIADTHWADEGIHKELQIRIALHNAHAIIAEDPITRTLNAYGAQINMAARLEPVTKAGEVFATEQFKLALDAYHILNFAWDPVGSLALAKDWGTSIVWRLRKPREQALPAEQLTVPAVPAPPSLSTLMPRADALVANPPLLPEVSRLLSYLDKYLLGEGLIRKHWYIHARYDSRKLDTEGIITENLDWSYELINIGNKSVDYELELIEATDLEGGGGVISFDLFDEDGSQTPVELGAPETALGTKLFTTRRRKISLLPGRRYKPRLHYTQKWRVNREHPVIHNSFTPRETSFDNHFTIEGNLDSVGVLFGNRDLTYSKPFPRYYSFAVPTLMLRDEGIEIYLKFAK